MSSESLSSFYKGKKVLITGHTGFKGSWLAEILLSFGADVAGVALEPLTEPNLFGTLGLGARVADHRADIRDYESIKRIFEQERPEIVFHLAAQALVRASYDDPRTTFETNIVGTMNVLESIRVVAKEYVRSVVLVTTDKVYKNKGVTQYYRESDCLGGADPYSASKAGAEHIIEAYRTSFFPPSSYGTSHSTLLASARAGNVIGGGDWSADRLIPDIMRSIFEKQTEVIIRNPDAVRPWQHVLDPINGYLLLGKALYLGETGKAEAWNFGPPKESHIRVEELVRSIVEYLGKGTYVIVPDKKKPEAGLLYLDREHARQSLSWESKCNMTETLALTLDWYRDFYENKKSMLSLTQQQINLIMKP